MRSAHRQAPTIPQLVVAKEISLEDVRLGLDKMPDRFERVERSRLFPGLDLDLLVSLLDRPTALQAIRALRPALAG
jgi:hypothetical protein